MEEKHFPEWMKLKEKLHFSKSRPSVSEGDIWWCSCGENVGVEINGKNELFSRPVFVYKKVGRLSFFGIPLTSQIKTGDWYVNFLIHGKVETAILSQMRMFSILRLSNKFGQLEPVEIERIKKRVLRFLQ